MSVCICAQAGESIHLGACMHAPSWQHVVMVLLPLTSRLKRCLSPLSLILLQLQDARQMSLLRGVCSFTAAEW